MVFSSSAAVYGTPDVDLVTESTPRAPSSPYGESKLIGEWLMRDQEVAAGLRHTSLRYFNVVGSSDPVVRDTALAHVATARRLEAGDALEPAYNLGSGSGTSVAEIMAAVARVTGIPFTPGSRRPDLRADTGAWRTASRRRSRRRR